MKPLISRIGIVLINLRQEELTRDCVDSLAKNSFTDFSIVIVDNCSTGKLSGLQAQFKTLDIKVIENEKNNGFCAANNQGLAYFLSRSDIGFIMLLNNDTIVDKHFLLELVQTAERFNRTVAVTPIIFYAHDPQLIWYAGGRLNPLLGVGEHFGFREKVNNRYLREQRVTYTTGCCFLISITLLNKIGLLREDFFIYMDDTEFSMRLKANRIPIIYQPRSIVFHRVSGGRNRFEYSALYLYNTTRNKIFVTPSKIYRAYLFLILIAITSMRLFYALKNPDKQKASIQILALTRGFKDVFRFKRSGYLTYQWPSPP